MKCKSKYLLPAEILSIVYRGKFLSGLEKLYADGELKLTGQIAHLQDRKKFKALLIETTKTDWVVYTKEPFNGAEQVVNYLGQYTHRIAISNHRLLKVENGRVHFKYRDRSDSNKNKTMVLEAKEFMRRFLLHVLPKKFVRIRHFGILGNRMKSKNIEIIRRLNNVLEKIQSKAEKTASDLLKQYIGVDLTVCPNCKLGSMQLTPNTS